MLGGGVKGYTFLQSHLALSWLGNISSKILPSGKIKLKTNAGRYILQPYLMKVYKTTYRSSNRELAKVWDMHLVECYIAVKKVFWKIIHNVSECPQCRRVENSMEVPTTLYKPEKEYRSARTLNDNTGYLWMGELH